MPQGNPIYLRRGDAATWLSVDPTLDAGEPGLETDTGLVKYGDGTTIWSELPYVAPIEHASSHAFGGVDAITIESSQVIGLDQFIEDTGAAISGALRIDDTGASEDRVYSSTKTVAEIQAAVTALVDGAPLALDTLNELAAALGDDANFASTVTTALSGKAATSHTHGMADLTAFTITSAVTGQILTYNGTKWVNAAAPASGFNSFMLMGA